MTIKQVTKNETEAGLEARIDAAIRTCFPFLPSGSITHQTTFSFSFGGKKIFIDGKSKSSVNARTDVIISYKDRPLAVLELKRPNGSLTQKDTDQGLSYARVLNPIAPLVIISNGVDTKFVVSYTGEEWTPENPSETAIESLIKSALKVAANDLKTALSSLMENNPDVWAQAIRQTSAAKISELTGKWNDRLVPFSEFKFPTRATPTILKLLQDGHKLIIIEGPPLIGKSNVLRDLTESTSSELSLVVLFIENESSTGILQQISEILSEELDWNVSINETRTWLTRVSNSNGPKLVIAIDGIGARFDKSRNEISDLSSPKFGSNLAIVVELNEADANRACMNSTGRSASSIGRQAKRVPVLPLNLAEFNSVKKILWNHRIHLSNGAQHSPELRLPWVLRAVCSHPVNSPEYSDPNLMVVIPSLLGIDLINLVRNDFDSNIEIVNAHAAIASAVLDDAEDINRKISITMEAIRAFIIRRKTLQKHLDYHEIEDLTHKGFLKPILHESHDDVLIARLPEIVVSELSRKISQQLGSRTRKSPKEAANWLSSLASILPLGDIITAQSILDATHEDQGLSLSIIHELIARIPRTEELSIGTRVAANFFGQGFNYWTVQKNGLSSINAKGEIFIPFENLESPNSLVVNLDGWLILSHLAGLAIEAFSDSGSDDTKRVDAGILFRVGKCPLVLRRPTNYIEMDLIQTHEIKGQFSIVCNQVGIVEPITLSILKFLEREGRNSDFWIKEAARSESLPLITRIYIALTELIEHSDAKISKFAQDALTNFIEPAFSDIYPVH